MGAYRFARDESTVRPSGNSRYLARAGGPSHVDLFERLRDCLQKTCAACVHMVVLHQISQETPSGRNAWKPEMLRQSWLRVGISDARTYRGLGLRLNLELVSLEQGATTEGKVSACSYLSPSSGLVAEIPF